MLPIYFDEYLESSKRHSMCVNNVIQNKFGLDPSQNFDLNNTDPDGSFCLSNL